MGFRRLQHTNTALLAKTGWTILTRPCALVSRVLKVKYFRNCNFLSASEGSNPSFIWRSLCAAKYLLQKGCVKRIGNGLDTRVYHDPWLPTGQSMFIQSIPDDENMNLCVADLIDEAIKTWNLQLLETVFSAEEINCIKHIPLVFNLCDDTWMWKLDRKGNYTVKSGYLVVQNHNLQSSDGNTWKKLRTLKMPAKVLNFAWRALKGVLPTGENLFSKKVLQSNICPACLQYAESIMHCLVMCTAAKLVWLKSSMGWRPVGASFMEWFTALVAAVTKEKLQEAIMLLWEIWNARNNLVWNGKTMRPETIILRASRFWKEWTSTRSDNNIYSVARPEFVVKWFPPDPGTLKCNIDAFYEVNSGRAWAGMLIRDTHGNFVRGFSTLLGASHDAVIAEILTVREALSWLKMQHHRSPITIEMDCLLAKQALERSDSGNSYFDIIVQDCKELMRDFTSISLYFVKRSAKQRAHMLARAASSMSDAMEWIVHPLSLIHDVITSDMNNI
uniref:Uncharacterized protein n=1 Tax=Nicotiana tabacum TaxID=4097 RepID=A0A1S3YS58_TOBAC|nr:PREDICTED: uncharacterized protein LOC107779186 [Nicotiana tabacum]